MTGRETRLNLVRRMESAWRPSGRFRTIQELMLDEIHAALKAEARMLPAEFRKRIQIHPETGIVQDYFNTYTPIPPALALLCAKLRNGDRHEDEVQVLLGIVSRKMGLAQTYTEYIAYGCKRDVHEWHEGHRSGPLLSAWLTTSLLQNMERVDKLDALALEMRGLNVMDCKNLRRALEIIKEAEKIIYGQDVSGCIGGLDTDLLASLMRQKGH